jgi:hypothetical protein
VDPLFTAPLNGEAKFKVAPVSTSVAVKLMLVAVIARLFTTGASLVPVTVMVSVLVAEAPNSSVTV